jgi:copper oxidase (laccase) domain-containing protein
MNDIKGFRELLNDGQYIIQFVMPEELCNLFEVELYGKGPLTDIADGEPNMFWSKISAKYSGKLLVSPQQVHQTHIIPADKNYVLPLRPEADGIYMDCNSPYVASLRYADCIPVVIACAATIPCLYILHSGFAGTCLNIVFSAQKDFVSRCAEPSLTGCKTWAWIGPGICTECYSRNKDDLKTLEAEKTFAMGNYYEENDIIHFDLKNEIKKQLIASHVPEEHIFVSKQCTCEEHSKLYSYRAGDKNKRLFLIAHAKCQKI